MKTANIFEALTSFGHRLPEDNYNDYLAFLLNPKANHGLGKEFLKSFIQIVLNDNDIKDCEITNVSIYREFTYDNQRWIDIVINVSISGDSHIFLIESKTTGYSGYVIEQLNEEYQSCKDKCNDDKFIYHIFLTPLKENFKSKFEEWSNNSKNKIWITWNRINDCKEYYHRSYELTDYENTVSIVDILKNMNSGRYSILIYYFKEHLIKDFIIKNSVILKNYNITQYFDNSVIIIKDNDVITNGNKLETLRKANDEFKLGIDKSNFTNTQKAAKFVIENLLNRSSK